MIDSLPSVYSCACLSVQVFLLNGRKRHTGTSSNYAITCDEHDTSKDSDGFMAKLRYCTYTNLLTCMYSFTPTIALTCFVCRRSNFVGTHFTVYDSGVNPSKAADATQAVRAELAAVIYVFNSLAFANYLRIIHSLSFVGVESAGLQGSAQDDSVGA